MKTKRYAYFVMAAAILAAMTGCSETENVLGSQPDPLAVKTSPESVAFDWQEVYQNKLEQFKVSADLTDTSMFDLCDITGDGVPELIISPSDDASASCDVYSLIGTDIAKIASCGSFGQFSFVPSLLVIGYEYEGEEFTIGEYQKYNEGFYDIDFSYYNNMNSASSGAVIRYELNGDNVSLAEYEEKVNGYKQEDSFTVGRKYSFGDEAMDYAIHCGESWKEVLTDAQKKKYKEKLDEVLKNASSADSAFELADLDGNELPEIVVSSGSLDEMPVNVYYLDNDGIKEIEASGAENGCLRFDIKANVFYSTDQSGKFICNTLSGESVSGFKPSESIMLCGRKYPLTSDNIKLVFD
ncbi:hypothetical protein [uncultured Ruminococcus sp.]|uniref:hypothetical protein n=1 Tax=uncultured Ruminococcus sp. TaxID=165186 RepID=UPI0025D2FF36|nr:hypothetical protein [uncultured Ruminococcus sp.]